MGELAVMERRGEAMTLQMNEAVTLLKAVLAQNTALTAKVEKLEREVHRLKPVTPAQAKALGGILHERAGALCEKHRAQGMEAFAANAIRKTLKLTYGVKTLRELPQQDFAAAVQLVNRWDDWAIMRKLRERRGIK